MKDSIKNSKPLAPASTAPAASTSAKARVAAPERGTLVKKTGNAKGGTDPYAQPKPSRANVLGAGGRNGAAYGIRVGYSKTVAPEATATQGNGRLIKSAVNRSRPNFQDGMVDYN
jgi:hypothetical protein